MRRLFVGVLIMTTTNSTYMLLVLPVPESEIGPDWAQEIITALQRIDLHDHSEGLGTKITPAGININAALDMQNNNVSDAAAVFLHQLAATLGSTNQGCLYRVGSNLYWNNGAGAAVQITSGGSVNAPGSGAVSANVISSYPYTVLTSDAQKVLIIDTASARTLNLPAASNSMFFMVKDGVGSAQTNNITIAPNGTDLIDGVNASITVRENHGSIGLVSDGVSKWYIV